MYQNSFLYVLPKGNFRLINLKNRGKIETFSNLIRGIKQMSKREIASAPQLMLNYRIDAPRKAKMNAWKRYLID